MSDDLALRGPKFGCGLGQCGACTVILRGRAVRSCVTPISTVGDAEITTLEGLGSPERPHPIQRAFIDEQAAQCGFCLNGVILTAKALLDQTPKATDAEIRQGMSGVLCRCFTHVRMLRAINATAMALPEVRDDRITARLSEKFWRPRRRLQRRGPLEPLAFAQRGGRGGTAQVDPQRLDSWIAISADGRVAVFTGKVELGQGMLTAQTQLVAEELMLPVDRITVIQGDTATSPDQGTTSGSQSTPTNFNDRKLALAAATAREALFTLGADRLGAAPDQLALTAGVISLKSDPSKRVTYAELLAGRKFDLPLDTRARRRSPADWSVLGAPVPRVDMAAMATGQFEFVHNVHVSGMLHGVVVRPPAVGASLQSVDESSVRSSRRRPSSSSRRTFSASSPRSLAGAAGGGGALKATWSSGTGLLTQQRLYDDLRKQPSRDAFVVNSERRG